MTACVYVFVQIGKIYIVGGIAGNGFIALRFLRWRLAAWLHFFLGRLEIMKAFQDYYPENVAHCYGCGRLNAHGHQIKTFWDSKSSEESVTRFTPQSFHTAIPGYVYGGLLASLIDCHGTGTAAAAMYRSEGRAMDSLPAFRFVTGSLQVTYLKPTPLGGALEMRGRVKEIKGRKVVVEVSVLADGVATARGEVVAFQMPESFGH